MKNFFMGVVIFLLSVLLTRNSIPADHYIRADAAGDNKGSDWTNAFTAFPSSYTRGDTYYIAPGTYSGNVDIASGESGFTWIYFKKATGEEHGTSVGWNDSYATGQAVINGRLYINNSYIDFDGITGSWNNGYGIKISAGSCSPGGVIELASGVSHVHVHHVEVSAVFESPASCDLFYHAGGSASDIKVSHSWLHDCSRNGLTIGSHQGTGWADGDLGFLFEYNLLEKTGGCTNPDTHGQGVQGGYSSTQRYHIYRGNTFKDIIGSANIAFLGGTKNSYIRIYNNQFTSSGALGVYWSSPAVIWIHDANGASADNVGIYNNTFYNVTLAQIQIWPKGSGNESINNLYISNFFSAGNNGISSRYNSYYGNTGAGVPVGETGQQNEVSNPVTNAAANDFTLVKGAKAINNGTSLSSYFNTDIAGIPRPQGSAWDIGAHEFKWNKPNPPTNVRVE